MLGRRVYDILRAQGYAVIAETDLQALAREWRHRGSDLTGEVCAQDLLALLARSKADTSPP